jgi:uroporphyrinogen III methyltransferase/synthase
VSDSKAGQGTLSGKRFLITRSPARARGIVAALEALGAECLVAATTVIEETRGAERDQLAQALLEASKFDWLFFTSANSVRACQSILREEGREMKELSSTRIAAVGEATQEVLRSCGLGVNLVGDRKTGEGLAESLVQAEPHAQLRILFPRARGGRDEAVEVLRAGGHEVALHTAYSSKALGADDPALARALDELEKGALDGVAFFAPSQVGAFLALAPGLAERLAELTVIATIGPTTAAAVAEAGLQANAVAEQPNSEDLADKILQAFS